MEIQWNSKIQKWTKHALLHHPKAANSNQFNNLIHNFRFYCVAHDFHLNPSNISRMCIGCIFWYNKSKRILFIDNKWIEMRLWTHMISAVRKLQLTVQKKSNYDIWSSWHKFRILFVNSNFFFVLIRTVLVLFCWNAWCFWKWLYTLGVQITFM